MSKFYLKDWHGKEKEFTDDKIFVRGENGELIQFTQGEGDKPAVVQPLEVTENGTYTAPDGVDGYSPVTVNVQGGGGGLPAGIYWKQVTQSVAGAGSANTTFFYNGKQYAWAKATTSSSKYSLYRLDDGLWTQVVSDYFSNYGYYFSFIEFGGKMHFLGGDATYHYIFDGATVTTMKSLPNAAPAKSAFVLEDTLYIKTNNAGIYKWIESSDTWEAVTVTGYPTKLNGYETAHVYNGDVYIFGYGKLYKINWSNLTCEQIESSLPSTSGAKNAQLGQYLYATNNYLLYRYDLVTRSLSTVGYLPVNANYTHLYTFSGELGIYGPNDYARGLNAIMHEVTE